MSQVQQRRCDGMFLQASRQPKTDISQVFLPMSFMYADRRSDAGGAFSCVTSFTRGACFGEESARLAPALSGVEACGLRERSAIKACLFNFFRSFRFRPSGLLSTATASRLSLVAEAS